MEEFTKNNREILSLVDEWGPKLLNLPENVVSFSENGHWSIKEILGHMTDSASNNIHRIVHLQYDPLPSSFPDYANLGNNDRWVAIQKYQSERWSDLVMLWKYTNLHIIHVIDNVDGEKLDNVWLTALGEKVSLKAMIIDYLRHFKLHIGEIKEKMSADS
ncbi:MAG: DinB family protein [Brevinematales bacterium]|jgi:hypothetical protein